MNVRFFTRRAAVFSLPTVVFAFAVFAVNGCGCGNSPNRITGAVRFNGEPLRNGSVTYFGADGKEVSAAISRDGEYRIEGVAEGGATIAVFQDAPMPFGFEHTPRPTDVSRKQVDIRSTRTIGIPHRYRDPKQSGLMYQVRKGEQLHNIDLTP